MKIYCQTTKATTELTIIQKLDMRNLFQALLYGIHLFQCRRPGRSANIGLD